MRRFTYDAPSQRIVFGAGAARTELAAECDRLGLSRLLLIISPGERARSADLVAGLGDRIAGEFTAVRQHVPVETASDACDLTVEVGADGLVSVGGGSTTGTAKAVALRTGLPIIAVPTTYAGSEATPVWGQTEGGRKTTGRASAVLPRTVLYDPELTLALPADVTATSGLNAIAHCVAALAATDTDPVTVLHAGESIRRLAAALPVITGGRRSPRATRDVTDADGDVLFGAYLAGSAFAVAGAGVHHKICHVLGGRFDLPHAPTHAVLLPHTTYYLERTVDLALVRAALGSGTAAGGLHELAVRVGAPLALRDLGLTEADFDEAVELVVEHAGLARDDASRLLRAAFDGTFEPAGSPGPMRD